MVSPPKPHASVVLLPGFAAIFRSVMVVPGPEWTIWTVVTVAMVWSPGGTAIFVIGGLSADPGVTGFLDAFRSGCCLLGVSDSSPSLGCLPLSSFSCCLLLGFARSFFRCPRQSPVNVISHLGSSNRANLAHGLANYHSGVTRGI